MKSLGLTVRKTLLKLQVKHTWDRIWNWRMLDVKQCLYCCQVPVEFENRNICRGQMPGRSALEVSVTKTCLIVINLLHLQMRTVCLLFQFSSQVIGTTGLPELVELIAVTYLDCRCGFVDHYNPRSWQIAWSYRNCSFLRHNLHVRYSTDKAALW